MTPRLEIKGSRACLFGKFDAELLNQLDLELSFRPLGYEYSPAYTSGRWDGKISLMSSNLVFRTGLVPRVVEFFKTKNIDLEVIDHNRCTENTPIDITPRLIELKKLPRPHQQEALESALRHKRGIIRVATGGGKTLVAAMLAAAVGKPTVIYVIGKDLLWQFHRFFTDIFQTDIGVVGDGECKIAKINIVSVWTAAKAFEPNTKQIVEEDSEKEKDVAKEKYEEIRQIITNAKVSILDECHAAASDTIQSIGDYIRSEYVIGMSATPIRDDNKNLLTESLFGRIIVDISASRLIKDGFLVKPVIRFLAVPPMDDMPRHYQSIYKTYIVENKTRNDLIVQAAKSLVDQGFVTLILFKDIKHGSILYKALKEEMYCRMLNGTMSTDKRDEVKNEIETGKCRLVLASTIFDVGVDIVSLSGLILAGGGQSIKTLQRIGRVIRLYPGKDFAAVIDFYDQAKYLKDHSKQRKIIYLREPGFEVEWPKIKKKR